MSLVSELIGSNHDYQAGQKMLFIPGQEQDIFEPDVSVCADKCTRHVIDQASNN